MDFRALFNWAHKAARPRSGVLVDDWFGADRHAYTVGGRVFMLGSTAPGNDVRVIVKVGPIRSEVLRQQHPDITPGGHRLSKRHWICIAPGNTITRALTESKVRESPIVTLKAVGAGAARPLRHGDRRALPRQGPLDLRWGGPGHHPAIAYRTGQDFLPVGRRDDVGTRSTQGGWIEGGRNAIKNKPATGRYLRNATGSSKTTHSRLWARKIMSRKKSRQ